MLSPALAACSGFVLHSEVWLESSAWVTWHKVWLSRCVWWDTGSSFAEELPQRDQFAAVSPSLVLLCPQHWEHSSAQHCLCCLSSSPGTTLPGMSWGQEPPSNPLWRLPGISSLEVAIYSNIYTAALMSCFTGGPLLIPLEDLGMARAACVHAAWWSTGRKVLHVAKTPSWICCRDF